MFGQFLDDQAFSLRNISHAHPHKKGTSAMDIAAAAAEVLIPTKPQPKARPKQDAL